LTISELAAAPPDLRLDYFKCMALEGLRPLRHSQGLVVEIADYLPGGAKGLLGFHQASLRAALSGSHVVLQVTDYNLPPPR
jgi:hypothetical protein